MFFISGFLVIFKLIVVLYNFIVFFILFDNVISSVIVVVKKNELLSFYFVWKIESWGILLENLYSVVKIVIMISFVIIKCLFFICDVKIFVGIIIIVIINK